MEAGTLMEWLIKPGDRVKRGDIVAVVETQKGAIEIEIFETGQVEQILVDLLSKVPVGTPLAWIRTEVEVKAGVAAPKPVARPAAIAEAPPRGLPQVPRAAPLNGIVLGEAGRVRVSPAARRLAQERGIDLATVAGSGPAGAIVRADIERSLGVLTEKKRPVGLDLDAMRAAIAAAMARSKREIPHYYLEHRVDVTTCEQWLSRTNAGTLPRSAC